MILLDEKFLSNAKKNRLERRFESLIYVFQYIGICIALWCDFFGMFKNHGRFKGSNYVFQNIGICKSAADNGTNKPNRNRNRHERNPDKVNVNARFNHFGNRDVT